MRERDVGPGPAGPVLGVLGGSGIYQVDGLVDARWERVDSPFGAPSDELLVGTLHGQPVVFLPRHGRGHRHSPSSINYRANIDALKRMGVTHVLSLSAVGSFREELSPGTFVLVDQFIDRTFARQKSFFGEGLVAHVSLAHPVCPGLGRVVLEAAKTSNIQVVEGGTYLVMEGPQFSTLAESKLYKAWGCDVIGMTNMPEAKLAREAELHYATVAMVTDYDCWHPEHDAVEVSDIIRVLTANAEKGKRLVGAIAARLRSGAPACATRCSTALDNGIITSPEARSADAARNLDAVAGRVLHGASK